MKEFWLLLIHPAFIVGLGASMFLLNQLFVLLGLYGEYSNLLTGILATITGFWFVYLIEFKKTEHNTSKKSEVKE